MHDLMKRFQVKKEEVLLTCPICGKDFAPKTKNQVYCSAKCKKKTEVSNRSKEKVSASNAKRNRAKLYFEPNFLGWDGEAIKDGWALRMPIKIDNEPSYAILSQGDDYLFCSNFSNAFFEKSHYVMLQVDGKETLLAECLKDESKPVKRLSTLECLDYLLSVQKPKNGNNPDDKPFPVGFYTGYDTYEILHDLSLADACKVFDDSAEIMIDKFAVSAIPKKFLTIRIPSWKKSMYAEYKDGEFIKYTIKPRKGVFVFSKNDGIVSIHNESKDFGIITKCDVVISQGDDYQVYQGVTYPAVKEGEIVKAEQFLGTARGDYFKDGILYNEYDIPRLSYKEIKLQDYSGYWQMSFEKTLEKNKHILKEGDKEIIKEGKALRNKFTRQYWKSISDYNKTECRLMSDMQKSTFNDIAKGFKDAGIKIIPRGDDAYSPGSLSNKAFKILNWTKKHPRFRWKTDNDKKQFESTLADDYSGNGGIYTRKGVRCDDWKERVSTLPFLAAYYGGRIESTKVGMIKPLAEWGDTSVDKRLWSIWNGDIRSAYPKGISMMPSWNCDDLSVYTKKADINKAIANRMAGMFLIDWKLPYEWVWYPFPYRSKHDSVYFPRVGRGWVSCLEYYAFIDTVPKDEMKGGKIKIEMALILDGTDNLGYVNFDAEPPTEEGKFFERMYNERAVMKKAKNPGEKALKLTPNGMYGKLIQQVGVKDWHDSDKMKNFNDFAAMWTTAYCRATAWLAIAEYRDDEDGVFSVQTDGIYSQKPLNVDTRNKLGCWEIEEQYGYAWFLLYMPGIYAYSIFNSDGSHEDYTYDDKGNIIDYKNIKRRGWTKDFNFKQSWETMQAGEKYSLPMDTYVTKMLAAIQPNRYSIAEFVTGVDYTEIYSHALNGTIKQSAYYGEIDILRNGGCEWHKMVKTLEISLGSKRRAYEGYTGEDFNFKGDKKVFYFPPKEGTLHDFSVSSVAGAFAEMDNPDNTVEALASDFIRNKQKISKPYIPVFENPFSMDAIEQAVNEGNDDLMNAFDTANIEGFAGSADENNGGIAGGMFER